ncbi:MAG: hypothetical protein LBW85_13515 [Deltaproteobacteria bacterium]|nr:hypothetical protein [Deltaproteobacteria bacterium]
MGSGRGGGVKACKEMWRRMARVQLVIIADNPWPRQAYAAFMEELTRGGPLEGVIKWAGPPAAPAEAAAERMAAAGITAAKGKDAVKGTLQ